MILPSNSIRFDFSSKFSEGNRWGYFPSGAVAWRISAEPFMKATEKWLDDLKLRFSIGTAGNNNIPSGQLVQEYTPASTTWVNGITTYWAPSKIMANPDLKWETTITRNLGLDFTLFGGKLNGSVEAYINTTKDLLISFPVAGTGYDSQYRNMGKTENKGVEISLTWHALNKKNYGLDITANVGINKNTIVDLGELNDFGWNTQWASTEIGYDYKLAVGSQLGTIIGYKIDGNGRYEVSDFERYDAVKKEWILKEGVVDDSNITGVKRPGTLKLKDVNGDGKIGEEDIVEIGNTSPAAFGGFTINGRLYGFDLTANFNYSIGNDVYNANKIEYTSTGKYQYRNMIDVMADGKRWTNLNEDGTLCNDMEKLTAMNANTTMWSPYMNKMILTDWAIEKASFLRLNTLSLGYTLPKDLTKKICINSLRFYFTVYNVFTVTNYTGMDPEADCIRKTNLTPNVDYSGYPRSRSYTIGLNLNF
ncbi:MAG: SusC/RagA family TonB-linked outer membrane protein [Bacteroidaceae bacterium]|nr:SusC/RagA family TonB-linked outer membrane protein [Bacteroidaceae bacterium]